MPVLVLIPFRCLTCSPYLFLQMAQPPVYEIDADDTIRTDALHWEGFPRILWETLSEVGYTTPPLYEGSPFGTRVFLTLARPRPCYLTPSTRSGQT
jgi:hypothetical protein